MSEASEGLSTSGWSGMAGDSPCAWCWLAGGKCLVSSPNGCMWGVHVYSPANFKLGVLDQGRWGPMLASRGTHECGVPIG